MVAKRNLSKRPEDLQVAFLPEVSPEVSTAARVEGVEISNTLWAQAVASSATDAIPSSAVSTDAATAVPPASVSGGSASAVAGTGLHWGWYVAGAAVAGAASAGGGGGGSTGANQPASNQPQTGENGAGSTGGSGANNPAGRPTVTITDDVQGTHSAGPSAVREGYLYAGDLVIVATPVTFTFQFSEPVFGFSASNVSVIGGIKSVFSTISGSRYTLSVLPSPGEETMTVGILEGQVIDADRNGNIAAAVTQSVDLFRPTVRMTDNWNTTATGDITFTLEPSETFVGFTQSDIRYSYPSGVPAATVRSASLSQVTITPAPNTEGTITLSIAANSFTDEVGYANRAISLGQTYDVRSPTVTISDNVTGVATGAVTFDITFSERVTGFSVDDVVVSGGTKGTLAGSGSNYSITVTPPTIGTGAITIDVAAGAAVDSAGNPNPVAPQYAQAYEPPPLPPRGSVIDLGVYGKLIHPVKVDGNWYYAWDMNGDGDHNSVVDTTGRWSQSGAVVNSSGTGYRYDEASHDLLDGIFTQDANGIVGGNGNTNDTFRYATLNGIRVALPTLGSLTPPVSGQQSYPGTSVDNNPIGEANVTYNDLLAIWDGHNGSGVVTGVNAHITGWSEDTYWSATPHGGNHALLYFGAGYYQLGGVISSFNTESEYGFVALQVL